MPAARTGTLATLLLAALLTSACGGTPRANSADLGVALTQPTPDPTLDAVVRGLPRMLAGAPPAPATATPQAAPTLQPKKPAPTPKPAPPTPTPAKRR